ncbi:unnamed protein product [Rotaria sordida]|uniref:Helix-turn-helix domain-containing protein n=1 Tax=Rotaria sordida TaxID=392033 RepID=A0A815JPT9_9BILA|nr:unnamed protein product [Rotaria sordida]
MLLDLFDYFNGVDLLRIFYDFNSLLYKQYRSYRFNFNSISKHNFDIICSQHLSFITDRIISLSLFDNENTSGQINLFRFYIPSFSRFTQLRSLSIFHLHSHYTLMKVIDKCHYLNHLNYLNFYFCSFRFQYVIKQYYKQTRGGAMGSAFTQVYANIYMLGWEQNLIEHQASKNEIYGRYIDDIFMTTNESYDVITAVLQQAQKQDVNIKINPTISNSVNFLDITIINTNGQLTTSIYYKPTADPYYLPYKSDHPHNIHRNIPYTALVRAARLCSNLHDFHRERLRVHVFLLLNGYRPHFISNHFQRFFQVNKADILYKYFDDNTYAKLHRQLLYQTSKRKLEEQAMKNEPVLFPPVLQQRSWNQRLIKYLIPNLPDDDP